MSSHRIEPNEIENDEQFLALIADCLDKMESGQPFDIAAIATARPDLIPPLRQFVSDHQKLARSLAPLATAAGPSGLPRFSPPPAAPVVGEETIRLNDQEREEAFDYPESTDIHPRPCAIGQYFLIEEVARGGMGVVFKARQIGLHRTVALKMILAGQHAAIDEIDRFKREAAAASNLVHPNIVRVHEAGEYAGQPFFTMDFIDGESLYEKLLEGPLTPHVAAELMVKIARAIAHAHQRGVVHRDLKPANILIDAQGEPHVSDFGLAKTLHACSLTARELTGTGQVLGTPAYMSPEQALARNESVAESSDVYSLGAILYASLTGKPPFEGRTPVETLQQVVQRDPAPPRQRNPQVPRDLETICMTCLQKQPKQRYHSASELADDLQRFLGQRPVRARRNGPLTHVTRLCRRRPEVATLLASLFVLAAFAIATVGFWRLQFEDAKETAQHATVESRTHRYNSFLDKAVTHRTSRKGGYRHEVWNLLRQASMVPGGVHDWDQIRQQAILCMGDFVGTDPITIAGPALNHANSCTLFLDDTRVLCGIDGSDVSFRNLLTRKEESRISRYGSAVRAAQIIDAEGDAVLLGDVHHLERWDRNSRGVWLLTWKVRATFPTHFTQLTLLAEWVLAPTSTGVQAYALRDGRPEKSFDVPARASGFERAAAAGPKFRAVAASPDDRFVAAAVTSAEIFVWDAATGALLHRLHPSATGTPRLQFDAESEFLVTSSDQGIHTYRCDEFTPWSNFRTEPVRSLATSPTGQTLLLLTQSGTIQFWDLATQRQLATLSHPDPTEEYAAVCFSSSGEQFLSCGTNQICVWNLRGFGEKAVIDGKLQSVDLVHWSPASPLIATASKRGTVRLFNTETGQPWASPYRLNEPMQAITFSDDGRWLAAVSANSLFVWSVTPGDSSTFVRRIIGNETLRDLCFVPGGDELLIVGKQSTQRWKVSISPLQRVRSVGDRSNGEHATTISLEHVCDYPIAGLSIAIASNSTQVAIDTGVELCCFELSDSASGATQRMKLSACGDLAVCTKSPSITTFADDGLIKTIDLRTGQMKTCRYRNETLHRGPLALTPGGRCAAVVHHRNALAIYDLAENKFLFELPSEQAAIRSIAFSGDGQQLAAGLADGRLAIWDLQIVADTLRSEELWGALALWTQQRSESEASFSRLTEDQQWQRPSETTVSENRLQQFLEQWAVPELPQESTQQSTLTPSLQQAVRQAFGAVSATDVIVLRLADQQLQDFDTKLQTHGYQLHRLCPFFQNQALWWSACWRRSPNPSVFRRLLTRTELEPTQVAMQRLGFQITQLGGYHDPRGYDSMVHFAVFTPSANSTANSRILLAGYRNRDLLQQRHELMQQHQPVTTHLAFDHLGETYLSEIWQVDERRTRAPRETIQFSINRGVAERERLAGALVRSLNVCRDPIANGMHCRVLLQPQTEPSQVPLLWDESLSGAAGALRRMMQVGYRPRLMAVTTRHDEEARATVVFDLPGSQLDPDGQWLGDWTDI